jgi:hypothetical protein
VVLSITLSHHLALLKSLLVQQKLRFYLLPVVAVEAVLIIHPSEPALVVVLEGCYLKFWRLLLALTLWQSVGVVLEAGLAPSDQMAVTLHLQA